MSDDQTCGKGLAEHSTLPTMLGWVMAAVAENLERHMPALDRDDPNARLEYDAYEHLAKDHREVADRLQAIGAAMAGYQDLPMGRHDMDVLTAPEVANAFVKLVSLEQELLTLLQRRSEEHQRMLEAMAR